ncbi:hypothetical protein M1I87_004449 [Serratia marcescens]|nr:hypothetical protein [Serratia marcescens]
MDKFSEPEQFDAEVEIHGGEPFAVWSPAVNGSHVKKEQYFALLAELEAKDKRIAELERANQSQDDHINQQQDRIDSLEKTNAGLGQRLGDAEKRLATPVRLTDERTLWAGEDDYDTGHVKGWNANRIEQAALLKKQGFKVEGDE